jgi:acetyltransferase-like isoleucine patch superfamily enzyme
MASYGSFTYGNCNVLSWGAPYTVEVGKFCSIATNVNVYIGGNHRCDWVTTYPFGHVFKETFTTFDGKGCPTSNGNVIIGNDVWIGNNATIMSGITVGDGSVIATNSHVVNNVEPYSIVGGNPAKLIKYRFTPEQISKLLEIKWWDWSVEKINKFCPLLSTENIDEFIKQAETN